MSLPCRDKPQVVAGTYCVVTCNRGFEIVGSASSVCENDGHWNPNITANCRGQKIFNAIPNVLNWIKIVYDMISI